MAFNTAPGRAEYTASAAQTIFTFAFKIYNTSDVKVYLTPTGQTADDATDILIETTDYTITINGDNGGDVILTSGAALNDAVTLVRDLPVDRDTEYQQNGDLTAGALNEDQDYQTYLILDGSLKTNERALIVPDSAQDFDTTLPAPGADKMFVYASDGKSINLIDPSNTDFFKEAFIVNSMQALLGVDETTYGSVNVRGYYTISDGGGDLFNWDSTIDKSTANAGIIIDPGQTLANQGNGVGFGCWSRQYSGSVNVKCFGAKKDTDSTIAIQNTHIYANSVGDDVSYSGLDSVKIEADAKVQVKTSTNFADCEFTLLNGINVSPSYLTYNELFIVSNDSTPIVTTTGAVSASDLIVNSYTPTKGLFNGYGFAYLSCAYQIPDRDRTGTVDYSQSFNVNINGVSTDPLSVDLQAYASNITVKYRESVKNSLVIKNLSVISDGWNNQILLKIERNNTIVNNVTVLHTAEGEYLNLDSLIQMDYVCDINLTNVVTTGRQTNGSEGSYVLSISRGANIYIDKMKAVEGWGSTGNNYVNGLHFTNCTLNRADIHAGGHNVYLDNCHITDENIKYGWGGGVLSVKNCSLLNNGVVNRADYGGGFFGSIIVSDCIIRSTGSTAVRVVALDLDGLGASTPVYAPNVYVTNVYKVGKPSINNGEFIPVGIKVRDASYVVYAPYEIIVNNINAEESWRFKMVLDTLNLEQNPNKDKFDVFLSNASSTAVPTTATGVNELPNIRTVTNAVKLNLKVSDCKGMFIKNTLAANLEITVNDCELYGLVVDTVATTQPLVTVDSCILKDMATGLTPMPIGGAYDPASYTNRTMVRNCYIFNKAFDLSKADALIGNTIRRDGTSVILPATVTFDLAFTGWKSTNFA